MVGQVYQRESKMKQQLENQVKEANNLVLALTETNKVLEETLKTVQLELANKHTSLTEYIDKYDRLLDKMTLSVRENRWLRIIVENLSLRK